MPDDTGPPAHDAGPDGRGDRWAGEAEGRRKVQERHPDWDVWVGIDRLWHARRPGETPRPATPSRPGSILAGEDPQDLMDQIRRYVALRDF